MPSAWQARIEHARQIAEDARARRDAYPVAILRSRYWAQAIADAAAQSWSVRVWCQQHPDEPLATIPAGDHEQAISDAMRDHDVQFHDGDGVA